MNIWLQWLHYKKCRLIILARIQLYESRNSLESIFLSCVCPCAGSLKRIQRKKCLAHPSNVLVSSKFEYFGLELQREGLDIGPGSHMGLSMIKTLSRTTVAWFLIKKAHWGLNSTIAIEFWSNNCSTEVEHKPR